MIRKEGSVLAKWLMDESVAVDPRNPDSFMPVGSALKLRGGTASLAVRINDVIIHDNRKLFGGSDIRMDVIVQQGLPQNENSPFYQPSTFRFPGVKKGDKLSISAPGLLIFYGRPAYFLDISVLVSRDRKDSEDLGTLISKQVNSDSWKSAASPLLNLAMTQPQALLVTAAVSGAVTIASLIWEILRKATGDTIGLYRTSWLQRRDRFGLGRHPETGTYREQDLEFWYEIVIDRSQSNNH